MLPTVLDRKRTVAPSSPDLELDVSRRASVGLFGKVDRHAREDIRTGTVREGRELGAGMTFHYRFGGDR